MCLSMLIAKQIQGGEQLGALKPDSAEAIHDLLSARLLMPEICTFVRRSTGNSSKCQRNSLQEDFVKAQKAVSSVSV